jgi:hypothetical protein
MTDEKIGAKLLVIPSRCLRDEAKTTALFDPFCEFDFQHLKLLTHLET